MPRGQQAHTCGVPSRCATRTQTHSTTEDTHPSVLGRLLSRAIAQTLRAADVEVDEATDGDGWEAEPVDGEIATAVRDYGRGSQADARDAESGTLDALLRVAGCPQHAAVMQENEFDVESLGLVELEDLAEIGIPRSDGERILAAAAGDSVPAAAQSAGASSTSAGSGGSGAQAAAPGAEEDDGDDGLDALLRAVGCPQHAATLQENEFDMETLGLVELEDLEEIGIPRRYKGMLRSL